MNQQEDHRRLDVLSRHLCSAAASPTLQSLSESERNDLRRQYEESGFAVVKGLFNPEELAQYRQRFEDICDGKIEPSNNMVVMKDVALAKSGGKIRSSNDVTKIQDFLQDPVFFDFCQNQKVVDFVCHFGQTNNLRAIHSMLINKPPDLGKGTSRHPMHQDLYYFPLRPAEHIVGTWVAMEHVHRENGCLSVIPGSHKTYLMEHGYPDWEGGVNKLYHGVLEDIDLDKRVYLEMQPGDCVFFHPLLIHGSGRNNTKGFRKAISCHYASTTDCNWHPVPDSFLRESVPDLDSIDKNDVQEFVKMMWINKSRQVLGDADPRWSIA